MRILIVNTVASGCSIGMYIDRISRRAIADGHTVAVASGRGTPAVERTEHIKVGTEWTRIVDGVSSRLFDRHGRTGAAATRAFIRKIEAFQPDIIHLNNIHGYYLHYPTLFRWLSECNTPILWTLHDCWALTGHCGFFDRAKCEQWRTECRKCPLPHDYPATLLLQNATGNYRLKKQLFNSVPNLLLLPVSDWLRNDVLPQSILRDVEAETVKLDIDLNLFHPGAAVKSVKPSILGAANVWNAGKNIGFFHRLREALPDKIEIHIVGDLRGHRLPEGIQYDGIAGSAEEMARHYARAWVFVNPTLADNYPQTNREALACGTPVVSRTVGGAVEDLIDGSGVVASALDDDGLIDAIKRMLSDSPPPQAARRLAEKLYGGEPWLRKLFDIYRRSTSSK